ncbi:MAG: DNA polymerase III subunit chi [Gammaproteobacteria bacterium]
MTRVDFYVLEPSNEESFSRFVCRLTEKAWRQGNKIFLNCHSEQVATRFDDLLWTYKDTSFIPHALLPCEDEVPVGIGCATAAPEGYDLLINLADSVPEFFSRFERVAETTGIDDKQRQQARERYKFYQQRGYALETHKISA